MIVAEQLGLRERKKRRTRQLIAETARALFLERGFDAVPVALIAQVAEVSEGTVFNHFATKEELALQGMADYESDLLAAVRDRPPDAPIAAAFGEYLRASRLLSRHDPDVVRVIANEQRMIAASPALQLREREILARSIPPLAALIAEDTGADVDDLRPWVVAHALIATQQCIIDFARRQIVEGANELMKVADDVELRIREALALLEAGFGSYGTKSAPSP